MSFNLKTVVYDLEGDGFLETTTKLHCAAAYEVETGRSWTFRPHEIKTKFLSLISGAKRLVCHNQLQHDLKVLYKLYGWRPKRGQEIVDTLVLARLAFPYQKELDFQLWREGKLPGVQIGRHGLKAWGYRLGVHKGDYAEEMEAEGKDPWAEFSERMLVYNVDDVKLNTALYKRCLEARVLPNVLADEQEIQDIVGRMQVWGFPFRARQARKLAHDLRIRKDRLVKKAKREIGIWYKPAKIARTCLPADNNGYGFIPDIVTPKKTLNYKDKGRADRTEGAPFCPVKLMEFNPQSRPQIIDRLTTMYGWNPVDFTEKGRPEVSDTVLRNLEEHIPICGLLADVFYYNKRLSQIATGQNAWLKMIGTDGAIHGSINPLGTVSRRASHASPNVAQVPKVKSKKRRFDERDIEMIIAGKAGGHGYECRSLFYVPPPWRLMGCDLAGIEFRCLAELCAKYDDGELINILLNEDIHTANQAAAGLDTRDDAKTFIYAFCVPVDTTQALTRTGWKFRHELSVGEEILCYDSETNTKRWAPILSFADYESAEVWRMQHNEFKVECTRDHRWFVRQRYQKGSDGNRYMSDVHVRRMYELNTESNVLVNAPMHPDEDKTTGVHDLTGTKRNFDWTARVLSMSHSERVAFLEGFLIADGHMSAGGSWMWSQNTGELSEAALTASFLVHQGALKVHDRTDATSPMIICTLNRKQHTTMQRMQREFSRTVNVWCPNTKYGSWVMRQGNTITITGNCYGGGDAKLGSIVKPLAMESEQRKIGADLRATFLKRMPALARVVKDVQAQAVTGYVTALDGGQLYVRSKHAALNLKLQSDAALIAKRWLRNYYRGMVKERFTPGWHADFVVSAWVHDEIQSPCAEQSIAVEAGRIAKRAAAEAGEQFRYRCPIDADFKIGQTWAATH